MAGIGRVLARLPRRRRRLVALAEDQPVLRVAGELRRHGVGALEPLPVQADCEAAVVLLLEQLVGAVVPDLDRAAAVLALRDLSLERRVLERMVLDVDGEVLLPRLEGTPLGTAQLASAPFRSRRKS